jgi:hypothetical protein
MIRNLRFCAVLLLIGQSLAAEQPRLIAASDIATVLHEGAQVRIGTRSKRTLAGTITRVALDGVAVQTDTQETRVPLEEIDWFRLTVTQGNKRTRLPLILCATVGAIALVAAASTEEQKSTYLPLAAAFTVGVGFGGYYAGKALDRKDITYKIK